MPHPMQLGDDPSEGYCRICGVWARPPYEGYYAVGVCSTVCFAEWQWRQTLRILRKTYHPPSQ
jgi:hypothetical protein